MKRTKITGTATNWAWGDEVDKGQSTGGKTGTDVVFDAEFKVAPVVILTPMISATVWITAQSTTGFSWSTNKDNVTVNWVARGNE